MYRIRRKVYLVTEDLTEIDFLHFWARTIPVRPYRTPLSIIDNLDDLDSSLLDYRTSQDKSTSNICIELEFIHSWQNGLELAMRMATSTGCRVEQVYHYNYS